MRPITSDVVASAPAREMKKSILKGDMDAIGQLFDRMWALKKSTAEHVSNPLLDQIYAAARAAGATGGKVSGAGGGGFMYFYCPGETRYSVIKALAPFRGDVRRFQFTDFGLQTWGA